MLERRVKLVGKDHGKGGVDTLPHLDLRDCESDLAVGLDAHERVRREVRVRLRGEHSVEPGKERLRMRPPPAATVAFTNVPRVSLWVEKIEAMDQSPSGRAGGLLDRGADAHVGAAPANVPAMAASMSESFGSGVLASKAVADMIWPDWQ